MSDEPLLFDLTGALPCVERNPNAPLVLSGATSFAYDGTGLTLAAFDDYVQGYDFGPIAPDSIVLHHTAVPSASWARYSSGAVWDANESGLTEKQIYTKRQKQLAAIRDYYIGLGWDAGPHLFVDERFVWLFTPMDTVGIHANAGNSRTINGKLHYSIGIEVVGFYDTTPWPAAISRMVGGVLQSLMRWLEIPASFGSGIEQIGFHRMWNTTKSCPGTAITASVVSAALQTTTQPSSPTGYAIDSRFQAAWAASGGVWQPNRLTPGYATSVAHTLADGRIEQTFERGVARLNPDGTISWMLLAELVP